MSGGKNNTRGTPQGGVASPLLSVIYMNRFLKHWRLTGRGEAFHAHLISYADDFVILSRGHAEQALTTPLTIQEIVDVARTTTTITARSQIRTARQAA